MNEVTTLCAQSNRKVIGCDLLSASLSAKSPDTESSVSEQRWSESLVSS